MKKIVIIIAFMTLFMTQNSSAQMMKGGRGGPYGDYCPMRGSYGARKPVKTIEEAKKILEEYFAKEDVIIGDIRERRWFFEAEIKDKNNNLLDIVIVHKRSGRIRSIY